MIMKYYDEAKHLWTNYVPKDGQADTVQGELIRVIEKLRDESQRNANSNWDKYFVMFCDFLQDTLIKSKLFDKRDLKNIKSDIKRIRKHPPTFIEDDVYDRLTDKVVEWHLQQKEPIKRQINPRLKR